MTITTVAEFERYDGNYKPQTLESFKVDTSMNSTVVCPHCNNVTSIKPTDLALNQPHFDLLVYIDRCPNCGQPFIVHAKIEPRIVLEINTRGRHSHEAWEDYSNTNATNIFAIRRYEGAYAPIHYNDMLKWCGDKLYLDVNDDGSHTLTMSNIKGRKYQVSSIRQSVNARLNNIAIRLLQKLTYNITDDIKKDTLLCNLSKSHQRNLIKRLVSKWTNLNQIGHAPSAIEDLFAYFLINYQDRMTTEEYTICKVFSNFEIMPYILTLDK